MNRIKLLYTDQLGEKILNNDYFVTKEAIENSDYFEIFTYVLQKDGLRRTMKREMMYTEEFVELLANLEKNKDTIDDEMGYESHTFERFILDGMEQFEQCKITKVTIDDVRIVKKEYDKSSRIFEIEGRYFAYRDMKKIDDLLDDLKFDYKINDEDEEEDDYYAYHIKFTKEGLKALKSVIKDYEVTEYTDLTLEDIRENPQRFKRSCHRRGGKGCDYDFMEDYCGY